MALVEREVTGAGFVHTTVAEFTAEGAPGRRVRLTTDAEAARWVGSTPAAVELLRGPLEARVERDLRALAEHYTPGENLSVAPVGGPRAGCSTGPFSLRTWSLGDGLVARFDVSPDGARARLSLEQRGRTGRVVDLPSVTLSSPSTGSVAVPYDTVLAAREVPGEDSVAVMVGTSACVPSGASVSPRAYILPLPSPVGSPLAPLPPAELSEREVLRVVAPRVRRRVVDELEGWFDDRGRWVMDTAWTVGPGRFLVQLTVRDRDLSPLVAELGQSPAMFVLLGRRGGGLALLGRVEPSGNEGPLEGTGQEAFGADLDGDGVTDAVVRARWSPAGETTTVLRLGVEGLTHVWSDVTALDPRRDASVTTERLRVRRCALGLDDRALLVRCHETEYDDARVLVRRSRTVRRVIVSADGVQIRQ